MFENESLQFLTMKMCFNSGGCRELKCIYLRVLAVLLSSALTLVCPEEMASVAILHMS